MIPENVDEEDLSDLVDDETLVDEPNVEDLQNES